ncbi:uncharacterized protein LOC126215102 [Schistocerca nitens]|uniref:uncharacterized protein LOC126215102 n=1 Tax=Schistocerca nitens TaxID=7011 RepID=UPI002117B4D1|nr:uncharacterized protein LOC126215102 [Schistocerca nitens]
MSVINLNPQQSETRRVAIRDLPDEILLKIFSHMSVSELVGTVQKVCSRWKVLSQAAQLWTDKIYRIGTWCRVGTCIGKSGNPDQEVIEIFRSAPNLRKVHIWHPITYSVLCTLYTNCHRLTELHLDGKQTLSSSELKNLVEQCPRIKSLRVPCEVMKTEESVEALSGLQHLRVLCLGQHDSSIETPLVLRPLAYSCPELEEIDFMHTYINVEDLKFFLYAKKNTLKTIGIRWTLAGNRCVLPVLASYAVSLECLRLYKFIVSTVPATEVENFTALLRMKNLQELTMTAIEPFPGTVVLAFRDGGLQKLKVLDLRSSKNLYNESVIGFYRACPVLRELNLSFVSMLSDDAFFEIYHLEHLEKLDVSYCRRLGGELIPRLTSLPHLHTLVMKGLDLSQLQPGLGSIVELSNLRCLTLNHSIVAGVPFDKFPGKLVRLRELNIKWCQGVPEDWKKLTEQMPQLKIDTEIAAEQNVVPGSSGSVHDWQ